MKTSKVKLDYMPSVNFQIVGLASSEIDYKLAYGLTRGFDTDFYLLPEIVVEKEQPETATLFDFGANATPSYYSVYGNSDSGCRNSELLLISNKCGASFLVDEFRSFDYLFIVRDDSSLDSDDALNTLRGISGISGAYLMPFDKIKSKKTIYDLWDSLQNRQ
ncbi:MAG: IPExxxVDY family protein [Bacteroidales bacterium]|nr:IPExxxVDY family protein [Bacteroidales bacterium]